jgi:TetR/AcrR family transcriptional regulator, transcriptional repressor for nem operon
MEGTDVPPRASVSEWRLTLIGTRESTRQTSWQARHVDFWAGRLNTRPVSLITANQPVHETKQRLLDAALYLLLENGYSGLGVQDVLDETGIPKGSFYHHFENKQDMAIQAVELYTAIGHTLLDDCLRPDGRPALERVRGFFERLGEFYGTQGYLGCLLGGLGQELAAVNDVFARKIEECISSLAARIAETLEEARREGALAANTDTRELANVLINAWEGAALRSRLLRSPAPLHGVLDFCLGALAAK